MAEKGMDYALGFVLKLAEAGRTFDEARTFVLGKSAADEEKPAISRRTYDRIYEKTRKRLLREYIRSMKGDMTPVYQGFMNPITGKLRFPISIGAKKSNVDVSTMTPAQANMVSLLTKHRKIKNISGVSRRLNRRNPDFEFMTDPTVFDASRGRFTRHGLSDFRKAYRYVHGSDPTDYDIGELEARLFGHTSGFDGSPYVFGQLKRRMI